MKLLHTADLHLDSPFAASGAREADGRREAQRMLLRRIFACAEQERCDLILIAGDLLDSRYITPETEGLLMSLLRDSFCPVVIAPGNHDPYVEGSFYRRSDLPEQTYVFSSSELQCFELEELRVKVWGYAFFSSSLNESPLNGAAPHGEDGWMHLLCAHADLTSPLSRYAPLTVGDIERFGVDYAALGHIHQVSRESLSEQNEIRYCGIPEGRSFDECGDGGVWIVTLEAGQAPTVERRILSEQRYEEITVDVSDCSDPAALSTRLSSVIAPFGERSGTHLRLTLTGTAEASTVAAVLADVSSLTGALASLTLRDETVPCPDGAALERDVTLRGALYRSLYLSLIHEDPNIRRRAAKALQIGLAAIEGRSIPEEGEQ